MKSAPMCSLRIHTPVSSRRHQRGQAIVETAIVASSVLIVAFLALSMIGRISDVRDRTLAAARYAAWERTVYFSDSWPSKYGQAATKSDAEIRSEISQRVLGQTSGVKGDDGSLNRLPSAQAAMWRDSSGEVLLHSYDNLTVSFRADNTGTLADKALDRLGSLSGIGLGFDLPTRNQQRATVTLHVGDRNPSLVTLWPEWPGATFNATQVLLTNTWTPDGSDGARALIAGAVPTAKANLIGYLPNVLAPAAVDIVHLDMGRIAPDVVPADRLEDR